MKINSGLCKGRSLYIPKSGLVRPATDKVKQALFNIIGSVENFSVLDLFAGCGSLALEALSRGANNAVFVDWLPESLKTIQKNIEICGFEKKTTVIKGKIPQILKKIKAIHPDCFDLVFIDPPYDKNLVNQSIQGVFDNNLVDADSMVIIEHSPREDINSELYQVSDSRNYGQTKISFVDFVKTKIL